MDRKIVFALLLLVVIQASVVSADLLVRPRPLIRHLNDNDQQFDHEMGRNAEQEMEGGRVKDFRWR
uniref:Uncharacterized protein n=1 Tax=Ciona intestinalis TaxID=7719 RepID=H2XLK5_CIOIN